MKKLVMTLCLVIGIFTLSQAQSKTYANTAAEKAKDLQAKLKLTDAQTHKVAVIYENSASQFEKIKAEEHGDNNKMAIKLAPVRRETLAKIEAILTASQKVKFEKMVKQSGDMGEGWSTGWTANS